MALPEGYKPREGDVLLLRGTVKYDVDNEKVAHVKVEGCYSAAVVQLEHVALFRRAWNEGEAVDHKSGWPRAGKVISTLGDHVWVGFDDQEPITVHANDLLPWRDRRWPLTIDQEAFLREEPVTIAMQEPAPAPVSAPVAFTDDEGSGAVLMRDDPPPPIRSMPDHCTEI